MKLDEGKDARCTPRRFILLPHFSVYISLPFRPASLLYSWPTRLVTLKPSVLDMLHANMVALHCFAIFFRFLHAGGTRYEAFFM